MSTVQKHDGLFSEHTIGSCLSHIHAHANNRIRMSYLDYYSLELHTPINSIHFTNTTRAHTHTCMYRKLIQPHPNIIYYTCTHKATVTDN